MEYIDHSDYKKALDAFKKGTNKKKLNESVEEGNAFTRALAKTPKGGKFKVGSKSFKDKSGYDDPNVQEYQYTDNYPGSWGYREGKLKEDDYSIDPDNINSGDTDPENIGESDYNEGLNPAPMQATGQTIDTVEEREDLRYITDPSQTDYSVKPFKLPKRTDTRDLDYDPQDVSRFKPDYMDVDDPDDDDEIDDDFLDLDDDDMYTKLPKNFQKYVSQDKEKYALRENQAPFGLSVLSVSEREQLKEYVKSVKTIQQEIKKLVSKAHEAKIGGDRTGLVMNVSEEEKDNEEPKPKSAPQQELPNYEEIEAKLHPELHDKTVSVLSALRKRLEREGQLTPLEIEMFIKHEIKKIARKAIMSQHDH